MCGIAGYFGNFKKDDLQHMLSCISHRGPDDKGLEIFSNAGLGQQRLAIIDLSPLGHQPMFDKSKELCIVFNGEIYNYQELKRQLSKDFEFKSQSDTEVLLYAYKKWGVDCLQRLNGMFAFVIYDIKHDLFFGARDKVGEKPLKYFIDERGFAFASEVKALLSLKKAKPDFEALNNFLTLQYVPAPHTGFTDVFKLPPGNYFIYQNKSLVIKKYWNINFKQKSAKSYNELKDLIIQKLDDSVKNRMISDVPVGALLSGGVDSSAVVALMAKHTTNLQTFNLGFDVKSFDETEYALKVSNFYGTKHSTLYINSSDLIKEFPNIYNFYDEPIADSSILPTYLVSKFAAKKVKVALCGDGGDENFGGYHRYNFVKYSEILNKYPKVLTKSASFVVKALHAFMQSKNSHRGNIFMQTLNEPFYSRYLYYSPYFTNKDKELLFSRQFNDSYKLFSKLFDKDLSLVDNALNFDLNNYLPENLLYKTDIASMANGLELRAPLLDPEFIEFTASIKDPYKVSLFARKSIFKEALLDKGILPKEIVYRPKRGFNSPLNDWFRGDLKEFVLDNVLSEAIYKLDMFDKAALENYMKAYFKGNVDLSNNIFALLSLSLWSKKYF